MLKHNAAWEKIEYYRIANHYRYIFKTFFDCFLYPRLIILEVRPSLVHLALGMQAHNLGGDLCILLPWADVHLDFAMQCPQTMLVG